MKHTNTYEPTHFTVYMQQALRPLSKRYFYSSYVKSLPLNSTDHVLDFGSGIGVMAEMLAQKLELGQLTCVDISNKYLTTAKRNLKQYANIDFHLGNLNNLINEFSVFDAINMHFVLHDIKPENRLALVNQMFELLRPGGKVFLREPISNYHGMDVDEIKETFLAAGFYPLFEEESKVTVVGDVFIACYAKISTMRFFFS